MSPRYTMHGCRAKGPKRALAGATGWPALAQISTKLLIGRTVQPGTSLHLGCVALGYLRSLRQLTCRYTEPRQHVAPLQALPSLFCRAKTEVLITAQRLQYITLLTPAPAQGASGYQMGVGSGSYEPRMSHPEIKDQPRIEPLDSLNSCNGLNGYIKTQNY